MGTPVKVAGARGRARVPNDAPRRTRRPAGFHSKPVSALHVDDFDVIVVAGGQAPMFTSADEEVLQRTFVEFYERGKVAAALCHGTAILRYVKAFNTTGWGSMGDPVYADARALMCYAGDDADAKRVVHILADDLGFDAVDAGPLVRTRRRGRPPESPARSLRGRVRRYPARPRSARTYARLRGLRTRRCS